MFRTIKEALLHLVYPHCCAGCGSDVLSNDQHLCLKCHSLLPATQFHHYPNNPIEKIFWGRLPLKGATAQYYFTKDSLMQELMHQFKYTPDRELGHYLGVLMGRAFADTHRFSRIDALVPLPLFAAREKKRGFNQAAVLCDGIASVLQKPVLEDVVYRTTSTESQTRKSRVERWQNMEGRFALAKEHLLRQKHVLLVDDVVTTGATLESCGNTLLQAEGLALSIATLCYSAH